ncbi:MAG: YeeE/YedE thiosulfate transporter family protein [Vulcanimicrobiaceae bacterium]
MNHFTPYASLAGGLLIGIATTLYLFLTGSYAGISGIARGAAFGDPDRLLDLLFIAGLIMGGGAWFWLGPHAPVLTAGNSLGLVLLGGVLVGLGTALGRGCTSGHGVCGLGRLSLGSLIAVVTFVGMGMLTVFITRHVFGVS